MAKQRELRPSKWQSKEPLIITSDLVVPPTIMGWERELLLPVAGKLVADLVATAEETSRTDTRANGLDLGSASSASSEHATPRNHGRARSRLDSRDVAD